MMDKTFKNICVLMCATYIAAATIVSPHTAVGAAKSALALCSGVVIPSLFPFIFCANIFIALGAAYYARKYLSKIMYPLFKISGAGAAAFFLGIISGYPIGAICAAELFSKGECTKNEAERLAAFCNNSGPMFVIGAVGEQMFGSHVTGVLLYLIHILSAVLTGMVIKFIFKDKTDIGDNSLRRLPPSHLESTLKNTAADIGAAVSKSVETILMICGFVVIFAVLTSAIPDTKFKPYLYSILEITGGLSQISSLCGERNRLIISAAVISFSGISVYAQVTAVLTKQGLSSIPYLIGKAIQAAISAVIMFGVIKLNKGALPVFNINAQLSTAVFGLSSPIKCLNISVRMLALAIVLFLSLCLIVKVFERVKTYILK